MSRLADCLDLSSRRQRAADTPSSFTSFIAATTATASPQAGVGDERKQRRSARSYRRSFRAACGPSLIRVHKNPAYRPATEKALETGFFYGCRFTGDSSSSPRDGPDGGFMEPLGAVARRDSWSCRL